MYFIERSDISRHTGLIARYFGGGKKSAIIFLYLYFNTDGKLKQKFYSHKTQNNKNNGGKRQNIKIFKHHAVYSVAENFKNGSNHEKSQSSACQSGNYHRPNIYFKQTGGDSDHLKRYGGESGGKNGKKNI